ncbi:conserved hypothetical protein [Ancylobacter novellus DSM 506]|uniref:Secreted protein n=1 Tax=Ancylobacter novellus (strain ATCC 8093 / DSM 506 / JCM 20403 / CCM 1077 / IAM 12100 / NBRC 12443 / NCIMB 10456) TaxID=639283 RepID=D7A3H7_ANCN5|nr:hypothetical protein [Ancylobacter novellus]ADH89736.1 conserved hypothetical protein [Ancylobacter novellus DSM 506]
MRAEAKGARGFLKRAMSGLAAAGMLAASIVVAPLGSAQAANFFEKNFWLSGPNYSGNVPACDTPSALSRIQSRFATTESRFWNSSLKITGFERVREIAFRPWGEQYMPRRYCAAEVYISGLEGPVEGGTSGFFGAGQFSGATADKVVHDKRHTIWYSIIEDGGFLGFSWGVEWCVDGLDRSWTYAPNCRMARP